MLIKTAADNKGSQPNVSQSFSLVLTSMLRPGHRSYPAVRSEYVKHPVEPVVWLAPLVVQLCVEAAFVRAVSASLRFVRQR